MDITQSLGRACSIISDIPRTFVSGVWTAISYVFSTYWYLVIPVLIIWVAIEIVTRNNHGYNSENGFTPAFNSFVGGGVFYVSQALIYLILKFFFGEGIYCASLWVSSFHLIPFVSTGLFLHGIGFWPYLKIPFTNVKIRLFR